MTRTWLRSHTCTDSTASVCTSTTAATRELSSRRGPSAVSSAHSCRGVATDGVEGVVRECGGAGAPPGARVARRLALAAREGGDAAPAAAAPPPLASPGS